MIWKRWTVVGRRGDDVLPGSAAFFTKRGATRVARELNMWPAPVWYEVRRVSDV